MSPTTAAAVILGGHNPAGETYSRLQGRSRLKPIVMHTSGTMEPREIGLAEHMRTRSEAQHATYAAPTPSVLVPLDVIANSTPLQIWEGTVVQVDQHSQVMHVVLDAKIGQIPRHTAEIDLEWVSEQDEDLVMPGAVFYLTLFKRTKPSVENAQELRFRRRPSWSDGQLQQIQRDANEMVSKMRPLPVAK